MSRETTFVVPLDVPYTPKTKHYFRAYLIQLAEQMDTTHPFGDQGQNVGVGFVWDTHSALDGGVSKLSRRMIRALRSSGIMSRSAQPYNLLQKTSYLRPDEGEPSVTFVLQEDDF